MEHQWYVHVLDCNGHILDWCGTKYTNIPTRCGHVDVGLPPGCYTVCATWSPGDGSGSLGNHLTHISVVRVNCSGDACVTLFTPTLHHCGTWFLRALEEHAERGRVEKRGVAGAVKAVQAVLAEVKRDPFTEAMEEINTPENKANVFFQDDDRQ